MGNANMTGSTPNPKSKSSGVCSSDLWDGSTRTDDVKNKLKESNAYIEVTEFCAPLVGGGGGGGPIGSLYSTRGSVGEDLGYTLCNNIGDNGQWAPYDFPDNRCTYNDCKLGYNVKEGAGCIGSCCGITGGTVGCARVKWSGDPTVCCFNDYDCNKEDDKCFQTPERQATCDTNYRDITSQTCKDIIEPYCVGDLTFDGQNNWLEIWLENSSVPINSNQELSSTIYPATEFSKTVDVSERGKRNPMNEKQPCLRAIARNITLGSICSWDDIQEGEIITTNVNESGLVWSRNMLSKVFEKYKKESGGGSFLTGINTDGINKDASFYNTLWNICNKVPLLCTNGVDQNPEGILPSLCSEITTEDIIKTPEALKWCGCHMPKKQYEDYVSRYGLPTECTPMCNQLGVIPLIDVNGERKFCQDNTCIIDDNNINLTNSEFTGGVNFTQMCPGCGKNNINRKYTRNYNEDGGTSSGSSHFLSFSLIDSFGRDFLANYYQKVYGGMYARKNFPDSNLYLKILYLPETFMKKPGVLEILQQGITPSQTKPYAPFVTITSEVEKKLQGVFGWSQSNLKDYLDITYGVSEVTVIFGLLAKTNCIGYVDAGFMIKSVNKPTDNNRENQFKNTGFVPYFLSDNQKGGYQPLFLDVTENCNAVGDASVSKEEKGFKLISNQQYQETIVSETSNKFSSGNVDGKVKSNTCTCIMDGVNLTTVNARVNGSINFTQECGKSKCYAPDGTLISCVDVSGNPPNVPSIEAIEIETAIQLEEEKYSTAFYILSAFMVLAMILILFFELRK